MKTKLTSSLAAVLLTSIFCASFASITTSAQEVMTNQTVVDLVKRGLSDKEIVAIVRSAKSTKFDVSLVGVEEMRKAGVSKDVIVELEQRNKVSPDYPRNDQRADYPGSPSSVRYRVVATGFVVEEATLEGVILTDGHGDEVFVTANVAEFSSQDTLIGTPSIKRSVNYGDTDGRSQPFGTLEHSPLFSTMPAGSLLPHGGLRTGDRYPTAALMPRDPRFPIPGSNPTEPVGATVQTQGRFIPMVLWEGELRGTGPHANAVLILPTIWENDNDNVVFNVWNQQATEHFQRLARNSSRLFLPTSRRRPVIEQLEPVLDIAPRVGDYSRPIGLNGDNINPLAASPNAVTFVPAAMLLTAANAEEAVSHGEYTIVYQDTGIFGRGRYELRVRVERLSAR